jgi:branched-chain amino acid transport system permease protein
MSKFVTLLFSGVSYGAILTLVALGFVVLYKATGVVNFAHGELMTLGAYLAVWSITTVGMPTLVGYVVSVALLFCCGLFLERIAFAPLRSRPPIIVVISTLAASLMIQGALAVWQGSTPKTLPSPVDGDVVRLLGADIATQRLVIIVVTAVVVGLVLFAFHRTSFGRQVRAMAADPETTQLCGVRIRRIALAVFGLSAALAALAGVLVAPLSSVTIQLGFGALVSAFAAIVLGGFGSLEGTVLAALAIGVVERTVGAYLLPDYAEILPFVVLFVVLCIRPEGLVATTRTRL